MVLVIAGLIIYYFYLCIYLFISIFKLIREFCHTKMDLIFFTYVQSSIVSYLKGKGKRVKYISTNIWFLKLILITIKQTMKRI